MVIEVEGIREIMGKLTHLSKQSTQNRVLRGAVRKAGTPTAKVYRQAAPRRTGKLKKSVKTRVVTENGTSITAKIGPTAPHANLVEFGTKMRKRKSGASTGRMPRLRPMRRAIIATRNQTRRVMAAAVSDGVDREIAKAAAKGKTV